MKLLGGREGGRERSGTHIPLSPAATEQEATFLVSDQTSPPRFTEILFLPLSKLSHPYGCNRVELS